MTPLHLLIADDDPMIHLIVSQSLAGAGWQVHQALDGVQAIEAASTARFDAMEQGLVAEGRHLHDATLEDLDEASLKKILTEPKNALVKQYQRLFEMESIDLTLAEEALGAISRKAIERKTGARGLRSIMEGILLDTMFDLPSLEGVEEVVISKEVVEGTARPLYIYADRAGDAGASAS